MVSHANQVWVGFESGGLGRFDPVEERFIYYPLTQKTPDQRASGMGTIFEDNQGYIWVGSGLGDLMIFNPKDQTFKPVNMPQPQASQTSIAWAILQRGDGSIWVACSNGLYTYNEQHNRLEPALPEPSRRRAFLQGTS